MSHSVASNRWSREAIEQLYKQSFQPEDYLKTYYGHLDAEVQFFLCNLHDFFSHDECNGACIHQTDKQVLEIGCGPTVTSIISASRSSVRITCTDFLERNRNYIRQWLATKPTVDVWNPFFQYVAELEGTSDLEGIKTRVREAIQNVLPCNVFNSNPLSFCHDENSSSLRQKEAQEKFDVIVSTLCLEFVTTSLEDYRTVVDNVVGLLKPGGYLILQGALGNNYYWLNGDQFPSLRLDQKFVQDTLLSAGCTLHLWKEIRRRCSEEDKPADHLGCFCCIVRKN